MTDLTTRATDDLTARRLDRAATKFAWVYGFHCVLTQLALFPQRFGLLNRDDNSSSPLRIADSLAFREYVYRLRLFDSRFREAVCPEQAGLEAVLGNHSLNTLDYRLCKLVLLGDHQAVVWEHQLAELWLNSSPTSRRSLLLRTCCAGRLATTLSGDTFYMQFRGLHQIPELLAMEVGDLVETAILAIRAGAHTTRLR